MRKRLIRLITIAFLLIFAFAWLPTGTNERAAMASNAEEAPARTDLPVDIAAWLALMPELEIAPSPAWLKVGVRITFHVMSAAREGDVSPAGESIVQYDVVSTDAGTVLAATGVHVIGSGGALGAVRDTGFVIGVPGVGDVWMAPGVLTKAEKHAQKNMTITHVSIDVNGVMTKAVRFEHTEGVSRSVSVFDEAKGVLLYRIQASGNIETPKQSSVVSQFISMRQLTPAWTGGLTPAWASVGTKLRYEGSMTVNVGYGTPGPPLKMTMIGQITNSAPAGVCVKWETYLSGSKMEEHYSLSSSAIPQGGIFLPQAALATLKAGKALDNDPVTGVVISVSQSPLIVDNKQLIGLVYEGKSYRRIYGYDRQSGMLTYFSERSQDGVGGVQTELRLSQVYR